MGIEKVMDPSKIKWINSNGPEGDIIFRQSETCPQFKGYSFPHMLLMIQKVIELVGAVLPILFYKRHANIFDVTINRRAKGNIGRDNLISPILQNLKMAQLS